MYGEHERPSTKRIAITAAAIVGGIVLLVLVIALAANLALPHYNSSTVLPEAQPTAKAAVVTPTAAPSQAATVSTPVQTATAHVAAPAPKAKAVATPAAKAPATPSAGLGTVVIDAGHQAQGDNSLEPIGPGSSTEKAKVASGATGVVTHNSESSVNLAVALKLQKVLEAQGVKVVMVRTTQDVNISNSARAKIANDAHAAVFIRLHCDGIDGSSSTHGLSTLIPGKNQWTGPIVAESAKAGKLIHAAALAASGAADRGVVQRSDLSGFNWSKVPTVLVEMGFMSNPAEDRKLGTSAYQQELAVGMGTGIVEYLKTR